MRFPFRLAWNSTASYVGLLAASFALALFVSYIFGPQINDYAYDSMFRAYRPAKPAQPESVVLAIDELTLMDCGGIRGIRRPIARALQPAGAGQAESGGDRRHPGRPQPGGRCRAGRGLSRHAQSGALHGTDRRRPHLGRSAARVRRRRQAGTRLHPDGQGRRDALHPDRPAQRPGAAAGAGAGSVPAEPRRGHAARIAHLHALSRRPGQRGDSGGRRHHPGAGGPARTPPPDARTLLPAGPDRAARLHEAPAGRSRRWPRNSPARWSSSGVTANSEIHDRLFTPFGHDPGDRNQCGRLRNHGAGDVPHRCGDAVGEPDLRSPCWWPSAWPSAICPAGGPTARADCCCSARS